jgi:competence protein ComEA
MRTRPTDDRVTELTRRRLAALAAELAAARGETLPPALQPPPVSSQEGPPGSEAVERGSSGGTGRHAHRLPTPEGRIRGWVADRIPPVLATRPHLGSAQAGLVLVIVAAGLVLSAWWLLRAGGSDSGVAAPTRPAVVVSASASGSVASPSTGAPGSADAGAAGAGAAGPGSGPASSLASSGPDSAAVTSSPSAAGAEIVVDVAGKVRRPGIAVLPAGSRVVDAVRAAGGVRAGVDRSTVNLARPLTDGEQVLIGVGSAAGGVLPGALAGALPGGVSTPGPTTGAAPVAMVDVNTADQTALETLPGVGPVTAQAILQWRTEHGGFTSVDELLEVSGIGDATLAKIAPYVTL